LQGNAIPGVKKSGIWRNPFKTVGKSLLAALLFKWQNHYLLYEWRAFWWWAPRLTQTACCLCLKTLVRRSEFIAMNYVD